jgi:DNA-binding LacI/PurR family transcriptional regulator
MRQVTQKDIAKALNISRETVTKAMKDHPKVSSETKKKVLQLANEWGYTPNIFASSLASNVSKTIGLLVPRIEDLFFAAMIEEIYQITSEMGYHSIPMISFEKSSEEKLNIKTLLSLRVAGAIANLSYDTVDDKYYKMMQGKGIPVVFFDRVIDNGSYSYVTTDDRKTAFNATEYAIKQGYRKLAHFAGAQNINLGRARLSGFLEAAKKYHIEVPENWIIESKSERNVGYANAMELLKEKDRPDFIFTFGDYLAFGVYDAAQELGLKIPDDLGVIGFGNTDLGKLMDPPLTTVQMPIKEIAREAIELLFREINNKETPKRSVFLESKLIIRGSAAKL